MKNKFNLDFVTLKWYQKLFKKSKINYLNLHINSITNSNWVKRLQDNNQLYRYQITPEKW